jgi:hypothetical protein
MGDKVPESSMLLNHEGSASDSGGQGEREGWNGARNKVAEPRPDVADSWRRSPPTLPLRQTVICSFTRKEGYTSPRSISPFRPAQNQ